MSSSLVHDPKNNTKEKAVANDNKNFFINTSVKIYRAKS